VSIKDPLIESVTPKTKWYVVLRPFDGGNGKFVRGEVVDTTDWRHTNTLETRRYIARLPQGAEVPEETKQSDDSFRRVISVVKTEKQEQSQSVITELKKSSKKSK
jgi:hypothetical protein